MPKTEDAPRENVILSQYQKTARGKRDFGPKFGAAPHPSVISGQNLRVSHMRGSSSRPETLRPGLEKN